MDEPTNHLDVEMVEWLEHYLNKENVHFCLLRMTGIFWMPFAKRYGNWMEVTFMYHKGDYENYLEKKAARLESEAGQY